MNIVRDCPMSAPPCGPVRLTVLEKIGLERIGHSHMRTSMQCGIREASYV